MEKPVATLRSASGTPTGRLAVWWVISSEIVIFGGILMSYLMHRFGHPEWAYQAAVTNTYLGAIYIRIVDREFVGCFGSRRCRAGDGKQAAKLLRLTALWIHLHRHQIRRGTMKSNTDTPSAPVVSGRFITARRVYTAST